jgi:hypothetical protein
MIMLIDTMAERYGMLPSEVMSKANTFDIFVADTAIGYRNYLHDKANGKNTAYNPTDYTQDDLLNILHGKD